MTLVKEFLWIALLAASAARADELYHLISDAKSIRAGADGSILVLTAKRNPTPGAWIQDCPQVSDSLTRVDGRTGAVLWSTCLPVGNESFTVDTSGAATIVGSNLALQATPGAYASNGDDGFVVIRLNPNGTGADWIATIRGRLAYPYGSGATWTGAGPDGSVYGEATVSAQSLPVTDTALRNDRPSYFSAYFFRLSADGAKLLYATYINDGNECYASDLAVDGSGGFFVGGSCSSFFLDYEPMATPGTFTTPRDMWVNSAWVARFDPATSGFHYVCVFGQLDGSSLKIALAPAGGGRVAIAGTGLPGVLIPTTHAFSVDWGAQPVYRESFVMVLSADGSTAEFISIYGLASVQALESDADGNLIVTGAASVVTTTANAWRLVGGAVDDATFALKLTADGSRVMYATGLGCRGCMIRNLARSGDELWIAVSDGSGKLAVGAAQPVSLQRPELSVLRALPDNWPEVTLFNGATLSWDTGDPAVVSAEIRRGAPNGPVVSRGKTGAIPLDAATATYYLVDTTGAGRVLGVETFTRYTALSGIPVYFGPSLDLNPNPVLSCREAPLSGTQTRVWGNLSSSDLTEIRVGSPDGPVFTDGFGPIFDTTGDWVRNGLAFFLVRANDNKPFGSIRAYVLPNRSCTANAPLQPIIRATRDCVQTNRFTLAWYAGTAPVEIREGSADGAKLGRFTTDVGLLDVTLATSKTYWLMAWQDGGWKPIASTLADPIAPCEQGAVP